MNKFVILGLAIAVLLLSGCGTSPEVDSPTETFTVQPTTLTATTKVTATPTSTPTLPPPEGNPTPTPISPTSTPDQYAGYPTNIQLGDPLPDDGAWLLVDIDYTPILISEDGKHRIEIAIPDYLERFPTFNFLPSPDGKLIAFTASLEGSTRKLYIWDLHQNEIIFIQDLVGAHKLIGDDFDTWFDLYFSTGFMSWSHDSGKLAFTSAHLGATTDLYMYDLATKEILWLTSGATLAVNPIWTSDDAYILHAGIEQLYFGYSGRGYRGWQFFSASVDGNKVHTLATGRVEGRGDEEFLGWVSDREILIHSGYWYCGWFDLRIMNIVTGDEHIVYKGNYNDIAFSTESNLALLYIIPAFEIDVEKCDHRYPPPGLRLLSIPNGQIIWEGLGNDFFTNEIINGVGNFFIQWPEQWYSVDTKGNIEPIAGDPRIPEQFWDFGLEARDIYGWVSAGGL